MRTIGIVCSQEGCCAEKGACSDVTHFVETDNRIAASVPGCYQHVKVVRPIGSPDVALLKRLQEVRPESANSDFVDALIVGIDLLAGVEPKKGVSTNMRLFLVTDAAGEVNAADLDQITSKMVELRISLNVVGVDFSEHGTKPDQHGSLSQASIKPESDGHHPDVAAQEVSAVKRETSSASQPVASASVSSTSSKFVKEDPSSTKKSSETAEHISFPDPQQLRKTRNEGVLKLICSRVRGVIVPVREALDLMSFFSSRSVTSHPSLRTFLDLGGVVKIPVWTYLKTKEEIMPRLVSISKLSSETVPERMDVDEEGKEKPKHEGVLEPTLERSMGVLTQKTFVAMDNPDEEIPREQQVRGYKYGKKYVPSANAIMPYTSEPCLKLIGFTSDSSVPRHYYTSSTEVIVPYMRDDSAAQAISALCHAMARTGMVGIVRVVKRKNSAPSLAVISPHIGELTETLYLNRLPFNDDLRLYGFASLVETEASPNVPKHALPNERQLNVTEDFINSLDLSHAATSTLGEPMEALKPKYTFNPTLQYFYQVILSRALRPNLPIPEMEATIAQHVSLDPAKLAGAAGPMQRFQDAFVLTKTETKEKENRRRFWSEAFTGEAIDEKLDSYLGDDAKKSKKKDDTTPAGLHNIHALLRGGVESVGNLTPVEDFKAMLSRRDMDLVDKAISEIQTQILRLINDSYKNSHYEKAIECLDALRAGCLKEQESEQFNQFLELIKATYKDKQRHDFWETVQRKALNLISAAESDDSNITLEQVRDFYASAPVPQEVLSVDDGSKPHEKSSGTAEELFDLLG